MGGLRSHAVDVALSRHHRERQRGGVVLSVLGQPELCVADFVRWASTHGVPVVVDQGSLDDVLQAIVAHRAVPLLCTARRRIAEVAGRSVDAIDASLAARSRSERTAWLAELAAGDPALVVASWVLASLAEGGTLDVMSAPLLAERLAAALATLTGPMAILVIAGSPTTADTLASAIRTAAVLCESLRPHAVALIAGRQQLHDLFDVAGDRASIALARQGLIEANVPVVDIPITGPAVGGRSRAERAFHAALDRDPRTRGRFALCHTLRVDFGGRGAEVDLYDAELAFAVEIDGWHHFREPDGFRRDREKDLILQRAGILVMRFLEEDVWHRLDYLLDQVADTVAYLRSARTAARLMPPR